MTTEQRPANITYTQAGVSCFVGQESDRRAAANSGLA
jgi:hypothetical protein